MNEEEVVTRLKQAARAKKRAENRAGTLVKTATEAFDQAVVDALLAGLKPAEVAKATDYSYETIRRIARDNNIARLREPTVTSRKPKSEGDSPA
jgi:hypothetical protein